MLLYDHSFICLQCFITDNISLSLSSFLYLSGSPLVTTKYWTYKILSHKDYEKESNVQKSERHIPGGSILILSESLEGLDATRICRGMAPPWLVTGRPRSTYTGGSNSRSNEWVSNVYKFLRWLNYWQYAMLNEVCS